MNKIVFFHIYAAGQWKDPVREFLLAYRQTGLINNSELKIGIVGSESQQTEVIQYFINEAIDFEVVARALSGWEQVTQIKLHEYALTNDGYVLYCHTKGAANVNDTNTKWRRSMYYYNIVCWEEAIKKLDEGFDAAGQHWMFPSHHSPEHKGWPFFGGTVWWTSLAHIRTLGKPSLEHRHIAEGWIGEQYYNKQMKCFDFTGHISAHPCHSLWTEQTQQWITR